MLKFAGRWRPRAVDCRTRCIKILTTEPGQLDNVDIRSSFAE